MTQLAMTVVLIAVLVVTTTILARSSVQVATIAGTPVGGIHCEEDETIFWVGVDTLGCVHADTFK